MKKSLVFVAIGLSILLVVLAMRTPTPLTMQRSTPLQYAAHDTQQTAGSNIAPMSHRPSTVTMPAPVVISTWLEAGRISDQELRTFVRKKADFRSDRVLYFEWLGCAGDSLSSESSSSQKKYTITLHSGTGEQNVTHRQIFIIPVSYSYDVQIGNN